MRCRLHQCLIDIHSSPPDSPSEEGWQAEVAGHCHQAFLESARQTTQPEMRAPSTAAGDTMQQRVGQMLCRATESAVEHEVVLPSGYTVDLLVRPAGSAPIAVEVPPSALLSVSAQRAPGAVLSALAERSALLVRFRLTALLTFSTRAKSLAEKRS